MTDGIFAHPEAHTQLSDFRLSFDISNLIHLLFRQQMQKGQLYRRNKHGILSTVQ